MPEDEFQQVIELEGPLFAINERSPSGVPAVELDTTTGKYVVPIFTSREAAIKYCYLHRPAAVDNIFDVLQGNVRVALGKGLQGRGGKINWVHERERTLSLATRSSYCIDNVSL